VFKFLGELDFFFFFFFFLAKGMYISYNKVNEFFFMIHAYGIHSIESY